MILPIGYPVYVQQQYLIPQCHMPQKNYTVFNYDKVDTTKIMAIEGNNIYNDKNKPTLKKWLKLAKKAGVTCEGVIE